MTNKHFKIPVLLLLILIFSACGATKISDHTSIENTTKDNDAIVFLVFKMHRNHGEKNSIVLVSQIEKEGKMKDDADKKITSENYLTIDLYQDHQLFKTIIKEHPLYKHVEYTDDNNQFVSKNIEIDDDEFFFRLQKKGKPIEVKISETIKNNTKKELIDLKI